MTRRFALAAAALVALVATPPALAADPIMPLADVRAGMKCTGLSVIRGTAISQFDVEVLDVIRGDPASIGPRIMVRVSGPAVDVTGVGPGFSGSPVICPGGDGVRRNAGAISETLGSFANKVVLATPIEQILGETADTGAGRSAPALARAARPLAGPITVAGVSSRLGGLLSRAGAAAGRVVLAAPSNALTGAPPVDLRPGAAVSAGLSSGDISIGSIGTVAYRDGGTLWAFGHPLDAVGRRSLMLQDAYVFGVIDNPLGLEEAITYKLAAPGRPVGAFTNDALGAAVGRVGSLPRTIPLTVSARDLDSGRRRSLRMQVSDERHLELGSGLDLVSSVALDQATAEVLRAIPPRVSSRMCVEIELRGRRSPLGFCGRYTDGFAPFDDLATAMLLIDDFTFGRIVPRSVSVRIALRRGSPEEFILGGRAPRSARAGQRIRVRLAVQRRRAGRARRAFTMRVPRSIGPGPQVLRIRGGSAGSGGELDEVFELLFESDGGGSGGGGGASPRSVPELAARIAELGGSQGLRATFAKKGRGPVVLRTPGLLIRGKAEIPIRVLAPTRQTK